MFPIFFNHKFIMAISLILMNSPLLAAGFDCKKARTTIEKTICSDSALGRADEQMNNAYKKLMKSLESVEAQNFQQEQREWLEFRNVNCLAEDVPCLLAINLERAAILNFRMSPQFTTAATTQISGMYAINSHMVMRIQPLSAQKVFIEIAGAEPIKVSWVCNFSGSGELNKNEVVITHESDNTPITFTFVGNTVEVKGENLEHFCGLGGNISGKYIKRSVEKKLTTE